MLEQTRMAVHDRILHLRSIQRIITDPNFEVLFHQARTPEKQQVIFWIENGNKFELEEWIKKQRTLEEMSLIELRELARSNGVRYYSVISKSRLIYVLREMYNVKRSTDPTPPGNETSVSSSSDQRAAV